MSLYNIEEIKTKTQELSQAIQKVGEAMHKDNPPTGGEKGPEEGEYKEK